MQYDVTTQETQIRLFEPEIVSMRTAIQDIATRLSEQYTRSGEQADVDPAAVLNSLAQFFDIMQSTEDQHGAAAEMVTQEMHDLGDYGIGLLDELIQWAQTLGLDEEQRTLQMISIPLALLVIRRGLQLGNLESVVNALSMVADDTHHTGQLAELSEVMEEIINGAAPQVRDEPDQSDPQRPWRILNLNHAIIATRTHDPQIMEATFQQLMYRLPEDAPGFFAEGMEQMDIVGYPDHVRELMQKYYELSHNPTLH